MKEIRKSLTSSNGMTDTPDQIIMGVNLLAMSAGTILPPPDDNPFNTPMTHLSQIDVYGRVLFDVRHGIALYKMITAIGGLHKLKLPHYATAISL